MKFVVNVLQQIEVTVPEEFFTKEFMAEFRDNFYGFDTIEEHAKHLAQMYARGIIDISSTFIEGYGNSDEFKPEFKQLFGEEEIV